MSIVTITINNKNFNLSCSEDSKERILILAEKLDTDLREMSETNKYASFELLLVMEALKLMDLKQSNIELSGGEALNNITQDFEKQLSTIFNELETVSSKVKHI